MNFVPILECCEQYHLPVSIILVQTTATREEIIRSLKLYTDGDMTLEEALDEYGYEYVVIRDYIADTPCDGLNLNEGV